MEGLFLNIKLQKENYLDWEKSITVNDNININAKLEFSDIQKQKLLKKAKGTESKRETISDKRTGGGKTFLWIAGIAAVGGGVAYYILSQEDDKKDEKSIFPEPPDRPIK